MLPIDGAFTVGKSHSIQGTGRKMGGLMLPPNPYLPDATGMASGNNYSYSPSFQSPAANFAAQAATTAAVYGARYAAPVVTQAVKAHTPVVTQAVKAHGPDMLRVCGRFGLLLLKALAR